ncbi:hypothetical protein [Cellulomonas sp. S1-8]|uniref:hypothetical protein n=1 Tax=Cellulomonas sp. S1-8 TaxID=2904790 RepID=UPI002243E13E|nr:hypothetical protein [Cellulomonas sp. S1-8]UZN01771.1 hypothetical protein OKX07_11750 [Cellulomonas sp. S1-8]
MTDAPPTPPGTTRIDFRRGVTPLLVGAFLLCAALTVLCVIPLVRPEVLEDNDASTLVVARVVLGVGALLFGAITVGGALTLRTLRRPAGLLVDHDGIDWWQGHDRVRLARWDELGAVAVTYQRKPAAPSLGAMAADRLVGHQGWALELWTHTPVLDGRHRRLLTVPADPAPVTGLPQVRRRLYLTPSADLAHELAAAVSAHAPHLWAGTLQRPWNPVAGS